VLRRHGRTLAEHVGFLGVWRGTACPARVVP
jgi:hypothetical protein